jgi:D-tyrosyl-tRNA(Tyr) deacylase
MLALVQRVTTASVSVNHLVVGQINQGLLAFICIEKHDDLKNLERMAEKLIKYRIFTDASHKMNLSVRDIKGGILLVPQFTLSADTKTGLRPNFSNSAQIHFSKRMFDAFVRLVSDKYSNVEVGKFGSDMQVSLVNDGPVTFLLSSK